MNFGIKGLSAPSRAILPADYPRAYTALKKVDEIFFNAEEHIPLTKDQQQFLDASRRATTDTAVRIRRTEYLAKLMFSQ